MLISNVLLVATGSLKAITSAPQREARILLAHVFHKSPEWCLTHDDEDITEPQHQQFLALLNQRLAHKPLAKILGYKEFYGRRFVVSEDVLDPRPDSEVLIEALKIHAVTPTHILDLGTGSGCLIMTALLECPNVTGSAVDISGAALTICEQNAQRLSVQDRLKTYQGSWFEPLPAGFAANVIISNPPYIPSQDIATLDKTVKDYDPMQALDGGKDGLKYYNYILDNAAQYLSKHGLLIFELGAGQHDDVLEYATHQNWQHVKTYNDLSGIQRCLVLSV